MPEKKDNRKQKKSARTFLPEILAPGTGLTNPSQRSVMPFNNVHTIQDVLNGRKYKVPGGGGDWSDLWGEDTWKSYKPEGDDYKRRARDLEILRNLGREQQYNEDVWKVRVPGGTKKFSTFYQAQKYKKRMEDKGVQVIWMTRVKQASSKIAQTSPNGLDSILNATFAVESIDTMEGVREIGTCFCISSSYFVTCAHVIKKFDQFNPPDLDFLQQAAKVKINLKRNNQQYSATLIAIDANADIAILQSDINCPVVQLKQNKQVGDEIMTVGTPFGFEGEASFGHVGSLDRDFFERENAPHFIFIDVDVHSGNSGGPIIDKQTWSSIGMVVAIVGKESDKGLSAGLPAKYIEQYCNQLNIPLG